MTKAMNFLNIRLVNSDFIPIEPSEILNNAGNVPKPKLVMSNAPVNVSPLASDQVKVE